MTSYPQCEIQGVARCFLRAGFSVVPLKPHSKEPAVKWRDYQRTLMNEAFVDDFFKGENNIAVVTGSISNLTVIDIDDAEKFNGFYSIEQLFGKAGTIVKTPKGYHLWIAYDSEIKSKQFRELGFEIKNEGCLITAPPSRINGHVYSFIKNEGLFSLPIDFKDKILQLQKSTVLATSNRDLERILSRLRVDRRLSNGYYRCFCPAHPDENASLDLGLKNGKLEIHCWAGCARGDILKAIGIKERSEEYRETQAESLVRIALEECELFHDRQKEGYAAFEVGGHREVWPIESREFKTWLSKKFYEVNRKVPNVEAISQALNTLRGFALFEKSTYDVHLRTAWKDGAIWYDIGDQSWRAIKITSAGWEVVERPPILFRRYQNMAAQVMPEPGGDLGMLLNLVNIKNEHEKFLLLAYLVAGLVPEIPKPIFHVFGEKGAGKSMLMRIVRQLIDPAIEPLLILRREERELAIQLNQNYCAFFDNISSLNGALSDMLCRAATGAGFTTRALYTNNETCIFNIKRAVGLNGIHLLTGGTDLQDRFMTIELERIEGGSRKQETEIFAEFESLRPKLFGAMLDALAGAIRIKPKLHFNELPRMADWSLWAAAAGEALGIGARSIIDSFFWNIGQVNERLLESHPVAAAVMVLMNQNPEWKGTPAQLLARLVEIAEEERINIHDRCWPRGANILSRRLKEVASNLRDAGIVLILEKEQGVKFITLEDKRKYRPYRPYRPKANNFNDLEKDDNGTISSRRRSPSSSADGILNEVDDNEKVSSRKNSYNFKSLDDRDDRDDFLRTPSVGIEEVKSSFTNKLNPGNSSEAEKKPKRRFFTSIEVLEDDF